MNFLKRILIKKRFFWGGEGRGVLELMIFWGVGGD